MKQQIIMGRSPALKPIKHIGTNGGGFFGMNSAHPFENPTPLTNTLHMLSMLLIPVGTDLCLRLDAFPPPPGLGVLRRLSCHVHWLHAIVSTALSNRQSRC